MSDANSAHTEDIFQRDMAEYEPLIHRPIRKKIADFNRDGRLKHVILSSQFTRELLDDICDHADMVRELAGDADGKRKLSTLLSHLHAMLYFTQPSTRTFLSFAAACRLLGIATEQVRDSAVSSETSEDEAALLPVTYSASGRRLQHGPRHAVRGAIRPSRP